MHHLDFCYKLRPPTYFMPWSMISLLASFAHSLTHSLTVSRTTVPAFEIRSLSAHSLTHSLTVSQSAHCPPANFESVRSHRSFVRSFVRLFVRSFVRLFVRLFARFYFLPSTTRRSGSRNDEETNNEAGAMTMTMTMTMMMVRRGVRARSSFEANVCQSVIRFIQKCIVVHPTNTLAS